MEKRLNRIPESHPFDLRKALAQFERGYLQNILEFTGGDRNRAAELLGISRPELNRKIQEHDIDAAW